MRILIISDVPTHPCTAGNRARIATLSDALVNMGNDVHLLHILDGSGDNAETRRAWGDRYTTVARANSNRRFARYRRKLFGLLSDDARYTYRIDEWYNPNTDAAIRTLLARTTFDAVIVNYVFHSRALLCFGTDTLKIIDTHDEFANRHRRFLERGEQPRWFSTTPRQEGKAFDRADLVLAIQDSERAAFERLTRTRIVTVGHITPIDRLDPRRAKPNRVLFVASENAINIRGFEDFLTDVLPAVRLVVPDVELALAGSICRALPDLPGVTKLGMVDDLRSVYESAAVVINPVGIQTGLSIKNLEALGFAKPLVTSAAAADALCEGARDGAFLVADSADAFARHVIDVLTNPQLAAIRADRANEFARQWNRNITTTLRTVFSRRAA